LTVDFDVRKESAHRVATKTLSGKWPGDRAVSREFESVHKWIRAAGLRTGKWFFTSVWESERAGKWQVGIEILGRKPVRGGRGVAIRNLPASTVAALKCDPKQLSPMVAYCSLEGWMKWVGKSRRFKRNGLWREVYTANPWKSKSAWAHTEIQAPVRK